jgi:hypothetical protein
MFQDQTPLGFHLAQRRYLESYFFPLGGEGGPVAAAHTGGTSHVHPLLSSFINYIQSVKFQGDADFLQVSQ